MITTRVMHLAFRERFRVCEAQFEAFSKQSWSRLSAPANADANAEKNWWKECYSIFKIIHQLEIESFGVISSAIMPDSASRTNPRFHLPQAFQAYIIDFWSAQQICIQDDKCLNAEYECFNCCSNIQRPLRFSIDSSYLAWIRLPGVYHPMNVAIWLGCVPEFCNESIRVAIDQLNSSASGEVNTQIAPVDALTNLDFSPVFRFDGEFSCMSIDSLSARDYFLYGPVARYLDRGWTSLEARALASSRPDYDIWRLASLPPVALQVALVLQSWFDAVIDAFPWQLFYMMINDGEEREILNRWWNQLKQGCSLHDRDGLGTMRFELTHCMARNEDVAPDHRMDLWLHNMVFWNDRCSMIKEL